MADSGTYTPETLARRYAMAQQLLADPKQPVKNWAQGLDELAKGAIGGYQLNKTENLERQSRADANAQIAAALGLPAPPPPTLEKSGYEKIASLFGSGDKASNISPTDAATPAQSNLAIPAPVMPSQAAVDDKSIPAAIRYNNPGAQWPGQSADKFGSTGSSVIGGGNKIAQFDSPVNGAAAQFDLLGRKYAGMPLGAAISKWSGGNNSPAYIASVSQATGLPPDTPLTPEVLKNPQVAIPLAKAMAKVETGRDYPMTDDQWQQAHAMAFAGTPAPVNPLANGPPPINGNGPSPLDNAPYPSGPIGAPPPQAVPALADGAPIGPNDPSPMDTAPYPAGPVGAPAAIPAAARPTGLLGNSPINQPNVSPPVGPTGAAPSGLAANPNASKIASLLTNPWVDASVKTQLLGQLNPTLSYQKLDDGTILALDPKGAQPPKVVYSAPLKPELKEGGCSVEESRQESSQEGRQEGRKESG